MSTTTADVGAGRVKHGFSTRSVQDEADRCVQDVKQTFVQDEQKTFVHDVKKTFVQYVTSIPFQYVTSTPVQDVTSIPVQDVASTPVQDEMTCSKCVTLNHQSARRNNKGMTLRACCALLVALLVTTQHVACAPRTARSVYGIRPGPAPPQPPVDLDEPDYFTDPIIEKLPEYQVLPQHRLSHLTRGREKSTVLIDMMQRDSILKQILKEEKERRLERLKEKELWQQQREEQEQQIEQVNNEDFKDTYFYLDNIEPEKRGSYMAMCHFKVCNMGKKRNFRIPDQQ